MSEQNEIKALGDQLKTDWEAMKAQMDRKDAAVADVKQTVETTNAALSATEAKINAKIAEIELKQARMEQLERAAVESKDGPSAEEQAFDKFFRKGEEKLSEAETKALSTDDDTQGGFTVPAPMEGRMITLLREFSPVRGLATVITIGSGNAWKAPKEGSTNFAVGKVGERDARAETTSGNFAMETIPVHEFYANPFVTQTMLDDSGFDVEGWISSRVSNRRAVLEGGYHISGTMEGEPEGLLTNAEILAAKVVSGSATTLTSDGLISLVFALPEHYARTASFMWRRATTAAIRKLKDVTSGQYLWNPGLNGSTAGTVLGYSYTEAIDMPVEGSNTYPVLFGDFKQTYHIIDRKGITLMRDPFSSKPYIEMYFTWRTGGQVVLAEAMRVQKCST